MDEDLDVEPLLIDMQRRVRLEVLPQKPLIIRFEIESSQPRFLLLSRSEASLCTHNPGFPEPLLVKAPLAALVAWWRGDVKFLEAQRMGLTLNGPKELRRAFPGWFGRYLFANIDPACDGGYRSTTRSARGETRSGSAQP
jgi:hypothetical protein